MGLSVMNSFVCDFCLSHSYDLSVTELNKMWPQWTHGSCSVRFSCSRVRVSQKTGLILPGKMGIGIFGKCLLL